MTTLCPGCHQVVRHVRPRCAVCGYPLQFVGMDDGPLELGVARDDGEGRRNDLAFFHETFESVIGLEPDPPEGMP